MPGSAVLVVDDEVMITCLLDMVLTEAGYDVVTAIDGSEALAELEANSDRFGAVLTDIRMPGVIDGWQVGERARELMPDIPVIYMSGDSAAAWRPHGVPDSLFLSKPYTPELALQTITKVLPLSAQP